MREFLQFLSSFALNTSLNTPYTREFWWHPGIIRRPDIRFMEQPAVPVGSVSTTQAFANVHSVERFLANVESKGVCVTKGKGAAQVSSVPRVRRKGKSCHNPASHLYATTLLLPL